MADLPKFNDFLWPIIEVLRAKGGSASNAEIDDSVGDLMQLSEAQLEVLHKGGPRTQVEYFIAWGRTYLKKAGLVTNSARGVWALTPTGREVGKEEVEAVKEQVRQQYRDKTVNTGEADDDDSEGGDAEDEWKSMLLKAMLEMSPSAFERLVPRLLREEGVESLHVSGGSGDGGIDGSGKIYSSLFSKKIYFQCKRWRSAVGPAVVREFRGAMHGRGAHGMIITTGTFTREAEREAERDPERQIDLVDGNRLCDLLKKHSIGMTVEIKQVEQITVDEDFFKAV
ncbi:MAG: restriction endonuclease [Planctomycetes bacterium]|nr:restriction endonuclease [Planctomycetota bacterium]